VARSGADFDSLKKADSDEPRLKPMTLVNKGLRAAAGERTRKMGKSPWATWPSA
jgi:hypothetical protein